MFNNIISLKYIKTTLPYKIHFLTAIRYENMDYMKQVNHVNWSRDISREMITCSIWCAGHARLSRVQ